MQTDRQTDRHGMATTAAAAAAALAVVFNSAKQLVFSSLRVVCCMSCGGKLCLQFRSFMGTGRHRFVNQFDSSCPGSFLCCRMGRVSFLEPISVNYPLARSLARRLIDQPAGWEADY